MSPSSLPDPTLLAAPFFILFMMLEMGLAVRSRVRADYEIRDTLSNLAVSAGSILMVGLIGGLFMGGVMFAWHHRVADVPTTWWSFLLCFVLDDLRYYWFHRLSHCSRWFWAAHVVHHSSRHYNLSVAFRQSWTTGITGTALMNIPLAALGFHPALIAFAASVNLIYQFWVHTETIARLPRWFEYLFNTPSHHRVHHGRNPRYLDANYAGVLMIWDRMFGSFVPEAAEEPVRYGLVHNIGTFNPLRIAFHEYVALLADLRQRGLSLRQRLGYLLGAPGWSHDGRYSTSAVLKAADRRTREQAR
ncbi:sterol desaturase family protein [Gluconacetobacter tumulisoli]|uniref:Sterol desaturase family protein n=2 Tax=Gluconacetobacter tumulisoli TaxID=1286189 RepID=A0A7W4PNI6_9PROT|nr:sterol desaturase family protein [Gluconacetobacter tumulisoli]